MVLVTNACPGILFFILYFYTVILELILCGVCLLLKQCNRHFAGYDVIMIVFDLC